MSFLREREVGEGVEGRGGEGRHFAHVMVPTMLFSFNQHLPHLCVPPQQTEQVVHVSVPPAQWNIIRSLRFLPLVLE